MTKLPRQILVAPPVARHALADPSAELRQRLNGEWSAEEWAGKRVAVAVGSRGIDRIAEMAGTVIQWLRAQGATPFIMPAMGSHGGATPDGQRGVLASMQIPCFKLRDEQLFRQAERPIARLALEVVLLRAPGPK